MTLLPVTFYSEEDIRVAAKDPKAFALRLRDGGQPTKVFQVPADQKCIGCPHVLADHFNEGVNQGAFCCHRSNGERDCKCEAFNMNVPAEC